MKIYLLILNDKNYIISSPKYLITSYYSLNIRNIVVNINLY